MSEDIKKTESEVEEVVETEITLPYKIERRHTTK